MCLNGYEGGWIRIGSVVLNKRLLPMTVGAKAELISIPVSISGLIAVFAIHRPIGCGSKGNFGFLTAPCAFYGIHLSRRAAITITPTIPLTILLCSSAVRASLWFVLEAFLLVKGLFAFREDKFRPAVSASKCFV